MATNYLYLDDERPEEVRGFIREVEYHRTDLAIELMQPMLFAQQMEEFSKRSFDGIILDLRLDQFGDKVGYRATSLAQEIRTRAAEGEKDCPLILWSTDERLTPSYTKDNTGHDLFDRKHVKTDFNNEEEAQRAGQQMVALAEGYESIQSATKGASPSLDFVRCLGFQKEPDFLDPRIAATFARRNGKLPAHEFALFLVHSVLEAPGPLLDADWVAARLGIDRATSPDFSILCERHLTSVAYSGTFADGWPRWWASLLERWWQELDKTTGPLRLTPAAPRVAHLQKHTRLKRFTPAKPLRETDSTAFWTLCQATLRPLDPRDGFVLDSPHSKPWHEKLYVSAAAGFTGSLRSKGLKLSALEEERFKRAREIQEKMTSHAGKSPRRVAKGS